MTMRFYKPNELNGSSYVKIPIRSSAIFISEDDDKYCFLRSSLAHLRPSENISPNGVSNYRQHFIEINFDGFDFLNGFKCGDVFRLEKLKMFSITIFEQKFHQDGNEWKHKVTLVENSKKQFRKSC